MSTLHKYKRQLRLSHAMGAEVQTKLDAAWRTVLVSLVVASKARTSDRGPWRLRSTHTPGSATGSYDSLEGSQQTPGAANVRKTTATRFARAHPSAPARQQFARCQPDS